MMPELSGQASYKCMLWVQLHLLVEGEVVGVDGGHLVSLLGGVLGQLGPPVQSVLAC